MLQVYIRKPLVTAFDANSYYKLYYRDHQLNWLGFTSLYLLGSHHFQTNPHRLSAWILPRRYMRKIQAGILVCWRQKNVSYPCHVPYYLSLTAKLAAVTCFRLGSLCTKCTSVYFLSFVVYIGKVHIQSSVHLYSLFVETKCTSEHVFTCYFPLCRMDGMRSTMLQMVAM